MKYVKVLGLLAVSAAAMLAFFAANASATTVTGPTITEGVHTTPTQIATPTIHAEQEGTHVTLHNEIANIECQSTVSGTVEKHGPGIPVSGNITALTFFNCTNGWVVDVVSKGSLEIEHIAGEGTNGTLYSTGATVVATRFGVSCGYQTAKTHIGTVTSHLGETGQATLHISASIPRHSGSFLCGSGNAAWTGSYTTTHTLKVEP